ncbi:MAG: polysaccharide biosynthesis tyrosine autokinase [Bacteroidaceae bacterium]|nr:polysaccharide biosynthesis tyrosine autokinase [Bacteroidaceae bacterium]
MSNHDIEHSTVNKSATEDFTITDFLSLCLSRWHWFLLSILVFMGLATLHLLRTTPTYTRSTVIMLKEEGNNGRSFSSQMVSNMGVFSDRLNINNEINTMQAPVIMQQVVERLHLDVKYIVDGVFHSEELYGSNLPINVQFYGIGADDPITFDLERKGDKDIKISNITYRGFTTSSTYKMQLGDSIKTEFGGLRVTGKDIATLTAAASGHKLIHISRSGYFSTAIACLSHLSVGLAKKETSLVSLVYTDASTQRAEDILNTVVKVYSENWIQDRNQVANSTCQFIDERLQVISSELDGVESDISSYKSAHLTPDFDAAAGMYASRAQSANDMRMDLNNKLYLIRQLRQTVTNHNNKDLLPTIENIGAISEFNATLLQRNKLASNTTTDNPVIQELDQTLATLRSSILANIDNEITALNKQMQNYSKQESEGNYRLASNPHQSQHLLAISRQQKVKESLYLFLLQKREEQELSKAFAAYNTSLVTPPTGSNAPTAPNRNQILLMALGIALILPAILIYVLELMNSKVRGRKDIESLTIPYIGEIPQCKFKNVQPQKTDKKNKKSKRANDIYEVVVKDKSRNTINEAFRVVRTNLEFMIGNTKDHKVIVTTSANPGSGKTFLTANIAASLAIKGLKIAMVDLDLRRASLSTYVEKPKVGVSNYLTQQIDTWQEVLVKGMIHENLDVVPVGTIPPNPTELLFSERLEKMLQDMRKEYDYIFIDCPPVEIVADTSIIAKWADLTIFIVRAKLMERDMLPTIQDFYDTKKYNNMAVLLNGTEASGSRKYGYRYGYRYGYNYGYGSYGYYGEKE